MRCVRVIHYCNPSSRYCEERNDAAISEESIWIATGLWSSQ
jgi:hypothetical protein